MASITRFTDPAMHIFKKTNLYLTSNDLLKYQDPTYLGFKLFFNFDQPTSGLLSTIDHPNTAMGYLKRIGDTQRAAYLETFVKLLRRINSETPWFWQAITGLESAWKHGYQEDEFKPLLAKDRKIEIVTLDESIDLRMTALMDLYRKACFDWPNRREIVPKNLRYFQVSIYCYEARHINKKGDSGNPPKAIDVFGTQRYKEAIIKNQTDAEKLFGKDPLDTQEAKDNPNDYKTDYINDNISRVMFDFTYCEWMPDESGVIVEGLSHKELANKPQKLVFSYRNVSEVNLYRMFGDKLVSDFAISGLDALALDAPQAYSFDYPPGYTINGPESPMFGIMNPLWQKVLATKLAAERLLDQFKIPGLQGPSPLGDNAYGLVDPLERLPKIARDAAERAIAEALRAGAPLRQFLLGNVWGFNAATLSALAAGGPAAAAQLALQEVGKNASKKNITIDRRTAVSGFDPTTPSLTNRTGSPSNESFGIGSGSLSNQSGSDVPGDQFGANSISFSNKTVDVSNSIGNNSVPANNPIGTPSGNYSINSTSLNNRSVDSSNPIGNNASPAPNSTGTPSGNYSGESVSLNNNTKGAPSGSFGKDSSSLTNGVDEDPKGNYGEGSISRGNATPSGGSIDNVYE